MEKNKNIITKQLLYLHKELDILKSENSKIQIKFFKSKKNENSIKIIKDLPKKNKKEIQQQFYLFKKIFDFTKHYPVFIKNFSFFFLVKNIDKKETSGYEIVHDSEQFFVQNNSISFLSNNGFIQSIQKTKHYINNGVVFIEYSGAYLKEPMTKVIVPYQNFTSVTIVELSEENYDIDKMIKSINV